VTAPLPWSFLAMPERGREQPTSIFCLGSSEGRCARSDAGRSRCPAIEATSVTAAVRTNEIITYEKDVSIQSFAQDIRQGGRLGNHAPLSRLYLDLAKLLRNLLASWSSLARDCS
jgi:hypothetical protein